MNTRILFLLVAFTSYFATMQAQDIHFSHIHASPMALNPAMTGVFEGSVRVIGNYRNQWKSVTADYRTFMASTDINISGFNSNNFIGLGAQVVSDVAGDLDFRTTGTSFSFSMLQAFDAKKTHLLSFGIQGGNINHRFDPSKVISFEDEPLIAQDGNSQTNYFDLSAGLLWYKRMNNGQYFYAGASILHLNNPNVSFYNTDGQNELYRRYIFHGGANLAVNKFYTLIPNFIYMEQGPHSQFNMGSFVRYDNPNKVSKNKAAFMLGAWMRSYDFKKDFGIDALIAAVRVDYSSLSFTISYDFNVSSLSEISTGRGGPEFSMMYTFGSWGGKKQLEPGEKPTSRGGKVKCPFF